MTSLIRTYGQSDNPLDSIQQIHWDIYDNNCKRLFVAGWDGYIRVYEIEGTTNKNLVKKWDFYFHHPVITMDNNPNGFVFAGLANGQIGCVDISSKNAISLGSHQAAICKVIWIQNFQTLLTFGYDCVIKVFSLNNNNNGNYQISEYKLPFKTSTVSYSFPFILIGSQCGKIALINVTYMNKINFSSEYQNIFDQQKHGLIKFSCSSLLLNKNRVVFGTADGRMITATYNEGQNGIRFAIPFVTKFEKKNSSYKSVAGQLNSICTGFKDDKHQFAMYCGNNEMGIFNFEKSMKTKVFPSDSCVSSVSVSPNLEYYAYGIGNDWSRGLNELSSTSNPTPPKIVVAKLITGDISYVSSYIK